MLNFVGQGGLRCPGGLGLGHGNLECHRIGFIHPSSKAFVCTFCLQMWLGSCLPVRRLMQKSLKPASATATVVFYLFLSPKNWGGLDPRGFHTTGSLIKGIWNNLSQISLFQAIFNKNVTNHCSVCFGFECGRVDQADVWFIVVDVFQSCELEFGFVKQWWLE